MPNSTTTALFSGRTTIIRKIHVRLHGAGGSEYVVTVYDMQGKLVLQQDASTPETLINTEAFEPGIYTVKVIGDKVYRVVKVVVE